MSSWLNERRGHYLLLIGMVALLTLPNLGAHSLWDIDEGYYCEASREMLERGDWITPTFNGRLFAEKPILIYWLQMAAYCLLGVNEFAARLPSVICSGITVLLTYELARSMFDKLTALWSAVILASCVEFSVQAHAATPDAPLLLFTMLALGAFWRSWLVGGGGWLIPFGAATALAVLTKGPVGVILPTGIVGLFLIWNRSLQRLWDWRLAAGLATLAALAAPWYLLISIQTQGEFLNEFLGRHNVDRFVHPMQSHRGSIFFQSAGIFVFYAPWCICLVATIWYAVRGCWSWPVNETSANSRLAVERDAYRFLLVWSGVILVFFSLAATKLPHYVYPLYPALAILTGRFLERWRTRTIAPPAWVAAVAGLGLVTVGLATCLGFAAAGGNLPLPGLKTRILPGLDTWAILGAIPCLAALTCFVFYLRKQRGAVIGTLAACAALYVGMFAAFPPLTLDTSKAPRSLAQQAGLAPRESNLRVGAYEYFQPSLVFYAQGNVERLCSAAAARDFLAQPSPGCLILPATTWQTLAADDFPGYQEVGRSFDFYRNYEVVAVSNQGRLAQLKHRVSR